MLTTFSTLALAPAISVCPPFVYQEGHGDIRPILEGDTLLLVLQAEGVSAIEPDELIIRGPEEPTADRPQGTQWDFLGTPAGSPLWILPQSNAPGLPFLGFSGESLPPGAIAGGVQVRLVDFRGPGNFTLYSTSGFGNVSVYFDTADGLAGDDLLSVPVGSHTHHWWAFTEQGAYELALQPSATTTGGDQIEGEPATFRFEIPPVCPADLNLDGQSTVSDLLAYLRAFRAGATATATATATADMNGDCAVDVTDLLAYLRAFRAGCP